MSTELTITSTLDLLALLKRITFAPSCVDMGWSWKVSEVGGWSGGPSGHERATGWLVSTTFLRPDRDTGVIEGGEGRKWFIERGTTVSGVVKTAFAAARMILEHELMEAFRFDGIRIFDPHNSVDALARVSGR